MIEPSLYVKMSIDAWNGQMKATNSLLEKISDEQLKQEVAPGRNRGIYLLGHLTVVHDLMLPLLRFGPAMYPELKPIFLDAPDKTVADIPSAAVLRDQWKKVNGELAKHFAALKPEEWFERHNSVSEEDFAKEPHRNRLNVILSRTNHLGYHRGQLVLLNL